MKKLEIIVKPESLEKVKDILNDHGCGGMTVLSVMGCGNQKGDMDGTYLKGGYFKINLLPKVQVIAYVTDEAVEEILIAIREKISTGHVGDGKVAVFEMSDLMRIRTGERGSNAI